MVNLVELGNKILQLEIRVRSEIRMKNESTKNTKLTRKIRKNTRTLT